MKILCDEFNQFGLFYASLADTRLVPTPTLLSVFVRTKRVSVANARTPLDEIVPPEVVAELHDITQYQDVHGAAASNAIAAREHSTVEVPYERADTSDSRPTFGLDDGETDGIVIANVLNVDGFLTDE